jgi:hypothetical protein
VASVKRTQVRQSWKQLFKETADIAGIVPESMHAVVFLIAE